MEEQQNSSLVEIDYSFAAPPESVFAAFTEPRELEHWIWGRPADEVDCACELSVGGSFCFALTQRGADGAEARFRMLGLFTEIDPPRRLGYTLHWDAPVGYNEDGGTCIDEFVHIDFEEASEGTALRFRQYGVPNDAAAREHERSIRATFDILAERLRAGH